MNAPHGSASTALGVVDDHRVFAEALASRLSEQPDLVVAGTASTVAEARDLLQRHRIDVLLLDLDLCGQDALGLCREVHTRWPRMKVVVVTGASDDSRLGETICSGAAGWVDKCSPIDVILNAIHAAALGQSSIPERSLARLAHPASGPDGELPAGPDGTLGLTERELDVLRRLMAGDTRKQAAAHLYVTPNTVRTHVQNIMHKLGVTSTVQAVALARHAGLAAASAVSTQPANLGPRSEGPVQSW